MLLLIVLGVLAVIVLLILIERVLEHRMYGGSSYEAMSRDLHLDIMQNTPTQRITDTRSNKN
jgi:hypothetical protein